MFNIYMYLNRAFEQFWGRFFSSLAILVDFRRFCTFCARLKTDPFGWVPSSVDFILAIAILLHADRNLFGFHFSSILVYRWPQIAYETSLKMSRHSPFRPPATTHIPSVHHSRRAQVTSPITHKPPQTQ
jgi:hypothetical protein